MEAPIKVPFESPFGLREAITVYPTQEEFDNAAEYIKSLRKLGAKCGIIKIVPPSEWTPPFCLDPKTFTLITRTQNLSRMGLFTRATINWGEHLYQFHLQKSGKKIDTQPELGKVRLNYYLSSHFVATFGGYEVVCKNQMWNEIAKTLVGSSAGLALEKLYTKIALPYTQYLEQVKKSPQFKQLLSEPDESDDKDEEEANDPQVIVIGDDEDEEEEEEEEEEEFECVLCNEDLQLLGPGEDPKRNKSKGLKCDNCSKYFHLYCMGSVFLESRVSKWWCPKCLCKAPKYTYDPGEEQTLEEFHDKCDEFRDEYFAKYMKGVKPTGANIEREFWTLVSDTTREIEVEYGADLVSDELGSGFPRDKKNGYARHPWNLNNLGVVEASLFRHLRKPISGVTSPWGYAGMMFSAFCWHSEDHFSYSVNYHHGGATKTWYGIPSKHADMFEQVSRKLVPEEFEVDADVLSGRATLLPPKFLADNGVDVFVINQNSGEFVITFPNAYHAGFNHGFNFNEAVNYVPIDWLAMGRQSADYYRRLKHEPAFSQEELLYRTFLREKNSEIRRKAGEYLLHELHDEFRLRAKLKKDKRLAQMPQAITSLRKVEQDIDTNGYHCKSCRSLPYFSRVRSSKNTYYCLKCVTSPGGTHQFSPKITREWVHEHTREFAGDKLNELIKEVRQYLGDSDVSS